MKRPYRMGRRAEAAERTRMRIIEAGLELFMGAYYSDVTLEQVASRAEVTLQTVIRRFESKEQLFLSVFEYAGRRVPDAREAIVPGDLDAAVEVIVETLEGYGDATMRMRHQSEQIDVLGPIAKGSHAYHRDWVAKMFARHVGPCDRGERRRRLAALASVMDVYAWRLLRRDYGLSKAETKKTMRMQVQSLVDAFNREQP